MWRGGSGGGKEGGWEGIRGNQRGSKPTKAVAPLALANTGSQWWNALTCPRLGTFHCKRIDHLGQDFAETIVSTTEINTISPSESKGTKRGDQACHKPDL